MGAFILRLSPITKTSRTLTADVVISYHCLSGLSLGWWWTHLQADPTVPTNVGTSDAHIFTSPSVGRWTSLFFRQHILYPSLIYQQSQGDGFLAPFLAGTANSIANKFWSLTSYRRGARTHAQRGQGPQKATLAQVYEHGRWRRRRTGEHIDVMYREWSLRDRLLITFYCF